VPENSKEREDRSEKIKIIKRISERWATGPCAATYSNLLHEE
jgi:hypothetical protein